MKASGQDRRPFHRDSLSSQPSKSSIASSAANGLARVLDAVVRGDYRPYGKLEYIPGSAIDLPRRLLPAATVHPRLITVSQISYARSKSRFAPQADWLRFARESAEQQLRMRLPESRQLVEGYSEALKNLAWVYRLSGNRAYLRRAVQMLERLPEPPRIINLEGGPNREGWGDYLLSAQALPACWLTLDLLWQDIDPALRWEVRRKLSRVGGQLADALWFTPANNHVTLMASAVLVTAMAEDQPEIFGAIDRNSLWGQGLEYLSRALGLIAPDGGYAEGVYYANFILNYLAPLSVYWENITGDRLFAHPKLERLVYWVLANEKNSGTYSGFDDAFQIDFFYLPLIVGQNGRRNSWYNFVNTAEAPRGNLVEAMAAYRAGVSVAIHQPASMTVFPDYGQVVFRDSPSQPKIFASFLSERQRWFADRHEHIDPLSFELSAYGRDFVVEGGYGRGTGDANRRWYLSADAHNGVLINGRGTYQNPLYGDSLASRFTGTFQGRSVSAATMQHRIEPVDLQRSVLFVNRRFFLITDRYNSDRDVNIGLNFNLSGRLSKTGYNRHRIEQASASLELLSFNSETPVLNFRRGRGLFTAPGGISTGVNLQIVSNTARNGVFATLLLPQQMASGFSPLAVTGRGEGLRISMPEDKDGEFHADLAVCRGGQIAGGDWTTDAEVFLVIYDAFGRPQTFYIQEGRRLSVGDYRIEAEDKISLLLEKQEFGWTGYVAAEGSDSARVRFSGFDIGVYRAGAFATPVQSSGDNVSVRIFGRQEIIFNQAFLSVPRMEKYHDSPDLLFWLAHSPDSRRRYETWSARERQIAQNQSVSYLQYGFSNALRHWSDHITANPELPFLLIDLSAGIGQASYNRNAASTYQLRFPHRLAWRQEIGDYGVSFEESGVLSMRDWTLNHLGVGVHNKSGFRARWLTTWLYQNARRHHVYVQPNSALNAAATLYQDDETAGWDGALFYRFGNGYLAPSYAWSRDGSTRNFSVAGRYRHLEMDFVTEKTGNSYDLYPQLLFDSPRVGLAVNQRHFGESQTGQIEIGGRGQVLDRLLVYPSVALDYDRNSVSGSGYSGQFVWADKSLLLTGAGGSRNSQMFTRAFGRLSRGRHKFLAGLQIRQAPETDFSPLNFEWHYHFVNSVLRQHLEFHQRDRKIIPRLRQQVTLRQGDYWYWQPILVEDFSKGPLIYAAGMGGQYVGALPTSLELLSVFGDGQWQAALISEFYALSAFLPGIDIRVFAREDILQGFELRVFQQDFRASPGIYYRYSKGSFSRLEGYLQWHW